MAQGDQMRDADDVPLVSILMPVFNRASYIGEALRSAQGQTYPSIEILVHDDGSTDGTAEIVEELAALDPRIRFTRTASNQGVASGRNRLIEHARGDFICWLDSDDIMLGEKIRVQLAFLDANPSVAAVATSTRPINAVGQSLPGDKTQAAEGGKQHIFIPGFATVTVMYRRGVLMKASPLRPFRNGSDVDLVLRVAELGRIGVISEELYVQRFHDGQMSRSAGSGYIIAIASNIFRAFGLGDIIAGPAIDEPAVLRQILRDRHVLLTTVCKKSNTAWGADTESRLATVLVLLHAVRRICTLGDRLVTVAGCLRQAPWVFFQVLRYWLKRRLNHPSRYL